jgi:hypothetical protein
VVYQINRQSESEVFDLNSVSRSSFLDPTRSNQELKDRAKRAVEMGDFPHDRANREHVQGHIEHLLDFSDAMDPLHGVPEIARRILVTGSPLSLPQGVLEVRAGLAARLRGIPRHGPRDGRIWWFPDRLHGWTRPSSRPPTCP